MGAMTAFEVQHAIDLGREASEYVERCGVPGPVHRWRGLLAGNLRIAVRRAESTPSNLVVVAARAKLNEFAPQLAVVASEVGAVDLAIRAEDARGWGDELYAAVGRARVPTCERLGRELNLALARLYEIRTALTLGRSFPAPDR